MGKGKIASQVAHASLDAALKTLKKKPEIFNKWYKEGAKKIVVKVKSLDELLELKKKASNYKIISSLIMDKGLTQLKEPSITALAIGPDEEEKIDKVTGNLKLL